MLYFLMDCFGIEDSMKLLKIWLIVIIICIAILIFGEFQHSYTIIFLGIVGTLSAVLCECSFFILILIKKYIL